MFNRDPERDAAWTERIVMRDYGGLWGVRFRNGMVLDYRLRSQAQIAISTVAYAVLVFRKNPSAPWEVWSE